MLTDGPDIDLLQDCVHCGFCLPACPTYQLWGEEMDSPRGRIHLMLGLAEGDTLDTTTIGHFDTCLGCMACMPASPSGVQYDRLIEATRAKIETSVTRPLAERLLRRLVFGLFPYPRRLRFAAAFLRVAQLSGLHGLAIRSALLRKVVPGLAALGALAPRLGRAATVSTPKHDHDEPPTRACVAVLTGCVQSVFFPGVNAATERVLAAEGCDVIVPDAQGCCGALSLHSGRQDEAIGFAKALISAFDSDTVDAIITNAAGCGSTLKNYGEFFRDDPEWLERAESFSAKVLDITEFLDRIGPIAPRGELPLVIAYHDACHLAHAQGIRREPRSLLSSIPGVELREIADADICCGSAGVYNIFNPAPAEALGAMKARNVAATEAQLLVAGNPGCLMQLQCALRDLGIDLPSVHTIEVLDASLRGADVTELLRS